MKCLSSGVSPQNPVYDAWKDFIDGGEIRGRIPEHILDGWLLSRKARIDPLRVLEVPVLERQPFRELCDRSAALLTAAAPVLDMLDACISGTGHMAILTASSGHILATVGDKDLLDVARAQYNMPGADRNIDKVGASAIGMALRRCSPVQIYGYEHYSAALHSWRCASAPILADASGVQAVLTISGNIASPEIQALALVTTFANYIGMRVRQQNIEVSGQRLEALLRNAHESLSYPLLVLNGSGGITHANTHAARLFTRNGPDLPGRDAASLVSTADAGRLRRAIFTQREGRDTLTFLTDQGPQRIACTFTPVEMSEGEPVGMALALKPVPAGATGDGMSFRERGRREGGAAAAP